jgi:glutamate/tyrosine decarboxylase-like PLP-dependent enzyme
MVKDFPQEGRDPVQVIDSLVAAADGGILGSPSGRFFAWVIGGTLPSALAADWLTSAWNQNAAHYACSPAASVVEEVAGGWLRELLGIPSQSSFAFTTGCQMAHFVGLAAARHEVLRRVGWDVQEAGLLGAPRVRILVSDQGLEDLIDRTCAYARALVERIGKLTGAEILFLPTLNQGLVRFRDPRFDAMESDHAARTDAVIVAINGTGEAFFSGTTWRGKRAMRVSVVNWRTTDTDLERTVAAFDSVLKHPDRM